MPTPTTLTVPQPCHENWATMTPATQGRHCAACSKVVVDFTQKTDAEILALLKITAAPCGRFRADQLDRPLLAPPTPAPRWRTWLAATATVLGLREVAAEQGHGQHPTAVHHDLLTRDQQKIAALRQRQQVQVKVDSSQQVLRGKVTDKSTGDGLPGLTVLLVGTTTGAATGADGTFELIFSGSPASQVSFSFIGYSTRILSVEQASTEATVTLETDVKGMLSGEVVVVGEPKWYTPQGLWQRVSRSFRNF
jgi:hypothetical protein